MNLRIFWVTESRLEGPEKGFPLELIKNIILFLSCQTEWRGHSKATVEPRTKIPWMPVAVLPHSCRLLLEAPTPQSSERKKFKAKQGKIAAPVSIGLFWNIATDGLSLASAFLVLLENIARFSHWLLRFDSRRSLLRQAFCSCLFVCLFVHWITPRSARIWLPGSVYVLCEGLPSAAKVCWFLPPWIVTGPA